MDSEIHRINVCRCLSFSFFTSTYTVHAYAFTYMQEAACPPSIHSSGAVAVAFFCLFSCAGHHIAMNMCGQGGAALQTGCKNIFHRCYLRVSALKYTKHDPKMHSYAHIFIPLNLGCTCRSMFSIPKCFK